MAGVLIAFLVLAGGWQWAVLVAVGGSRRGLIAAALFSLFPVIAAASDLLVFCPSPCKSTWPLAEISHWLTLLSGLIAIVAVGVYLRGDKKTTS